MKALLWRRTALLGVAASIGDMAAANGQVAGRSNILTTEAGERSKRLLLDPELVKVIGRDNVHLEVDEAGAAGQNRKGLAHIELQGLGYEILRRGLFSANEARISDAWKVLDWGLKQQ